MAFKMKGWSGYTNPSPFKLEGIWDKIKSKVTGKLAGKVASKGAAK